MGHTLVASFALLGSFIALPTDNQPADATTALPASEQKALLQARENIWRSWFTNDRAKLEELVPAETIAGSGGESGWQHRDKILAASEKFVASGSKLVDLQFTGTEIQSYGDVAIVYTTYRFEIENNGRRSVTTGKATEIFVKRAGRWVNPGWLMCSDK